MIVVSVRRDTDVGLAQALHVALSKRHPVYALCSDPSLALRCAERGLSAGADTAEWMLNPQRVGVLVSFRSTSADREYAEMELVQFFDAVGIPTLEIQHGLFQPGFGDAERTALVARSGSLETVQPDSISCAARSVLRWTGSDGIGYPRAVLYAAPREPDASDFTLVLTNLHAPDYTSRERYRFVFALLELAAAHPQRHFVWAPHPGEATDADARLALDVLREYEAPNIAFNTAVPVERLIATAARVVCTLATHLVDLALTETPAVVFVPAARADQASATCPLRFDDGDALLVAFAELLESPRKGLIHTEISALAPAVLEARIVAALAERTLRQDHLALALSRLPGLVHRSPAVVAESDAAPPASVMRELARVLDKLGVVQRSMLAYKAKRFAKRFRL